MSQVRRYQRPQPRPSRFWAAPRNPKALQQQQEVQVRLQEEEAVTTMIETAHRVAMRDQRADAIRLLEDQYEALMTAAARCEFTAAVTQGVRDRMAESLAQLRCWCVQLFGPDAPQVDENCTCWMCGYCDESEVTDPFEDER